MNCESRLQALSGLVARIYLGAVFLLATVLVARSGL